MAKHRVTSHECEVSDFELLESVPDAMLIVDDRGNIVYANRVTEALFGYSREELDGQTIELLLPARFRTAHRSHRHSYASAPYVRQMGIGMELCGLKKNGAEFPAEISLAPMERGGSRYIVAAVRDVTERKRIEERSRLYQRVQEELRQRDEFLSIAAHELKTPVAALQLQLQLLQRAALPASAELPVGLAKRLLGFERQTRRIVSLVSELLDVSRVRLGKMTLKREQVDLAQLVEEAVEQLRGEAEQTGSHLELRTMSLVGHWDRLRLEQVVTNLVGNAIKFGQGRPIAVSLGQDSGRARIDVEDHGVGIAPEDQVRIFDRFERAASTSHVGGMGLGLYIARAIVEAHGGTIQLRSLPGQGSTFTVLLPMSGFG